ncbi:MAG: MogA/MoaB family molybdenum cofactor biosynthesis protein [Thermoleophilia bacterium]|nr:MogA/MoaB family molybdenum cofactor biosynthesis protein [Thermoleophilia bacterium]
MMRVATITISTSKSAGEGEDKCTPALKDYVDSLGAELVGSDLIPDDREQIEQRLRHWSEPNRADVVFTSGGTGLAPSDVTPEATLAVIEREASGIAEALRLAAKDHTKYWMMSRGVAGVRGRTLIVNFPGNPKSIAECGAPLVDTLEHAMALLIDRGDTGH